MTNDNDAAPGEASRPSPDAHGLAALLLVESLIHGLCAEGTLSVPASVEIAERAVDVQRDQAEATAGETASQWEAHRLLSSIAMSLGTDDLNPPTPRP